MTSADLDSHRNIDARADGVGEGFLSWFAERVRMSGCQVDLTPLNELRGWAFDEATGNLAHESGRFFVVEGLHIRTTYGPVREWSQPIINQPEIGILGLLVKTVDGVPYCLVQAKMEPGNLNTMQLSPTVQATRSNYTRIHRGGGTKYLEYFTRPQAGRVLVDVLQSEQGSWFLRKRNRNMVVQVDDTVPAADGHYWLSLHEIRQLLRVDGLVNMDTRTVLSCLPDSFLAGPGGALAEEGMAAAIVRSVSGEGRPHHSAAAVLSWFTSAKCRHELAVQRVPLRGLPGWRRTPEEITHDDGRHFSIVGVTVRTNHREVAEWNQPLLYPQGRGLVAFVVKSIGGVAHLLVHARFQAGLLDIMEMGPTVQCNPENYPGARPEFLDYVLRAPAERIVYDTVLAEEGGRFYHSQNRYLLLEAGEDFPLEVPDDFCWVTAHQLTTLLRHGYYINVEARSLLACLHSLW
ncbi:MULTISPECIES: NDP-hexose 2,3-dehydratase family protein [Streptosporangium]|uniref:Oxidase EvaA n=1 Tax=Streptosporangium brasiliense TaxID=47480 RepID=A0ABT9R318_9ACTN|nr:NDP-hexose 2,3-dehydratase family protein [Streptosporangium brasiliense]MDP9863628.1 oxidase EvaA [Streptosporangium brasiliense]